MFYYFVSTMKRRERPGSHYGNVFIAFGTYNPNRFKADEQYIWYNIHYAYRIWDTLSFNLIMSILKATR